ncbi:general stress protein [Methylocystis hirsuta]|uniref:Stress-induced protein n=1 Tax=Methylocystis hirsuta TaxID=369798 RepID=A0A3M9XL59_9HYPH|nr:general stress protein [Methylocystis hirsuta]RNJ48973.1 stress-induced protein [Methylocystis hirsuta]
MDTVSATTKSRRGFASMTPERQREIARKGGKSVPSEQRSFAKNPDLASTAGRKGGLAVNAAKRSFSVDRQLAAQAGRKGGHASRNTRTEDEGISGGA